VKPADLLDLLQGLYRDKLALTLGRQEAARWVSRYEFNNAFQYALARDETHLAWLRGAIVEQGGTPPEVAAPPAVAGPKGAAVLDDESRRTQTFMDAWRDRVGSITNARHKKMIELMLGETMEQVRMFQQATAGRGDLLGRRAEGAGTPGRVLPTRWLE
jgi:hypothetical protein